MLMEVEIKRRRWIYNILEVESTELGNELDVRVNRREEIKNYQFISLAINFNSFDVYRMCLVFFWFQLK